MAGVTATGFELKSLTEIVDEVNVAMVAALGAGFNTALDTPQGQLINVFADAQSTMWELMQGVYGSFDVRQAQGARLDQLGEFRNIDRIVGETDAAYRLRLLTPFNPTEAAVGTLQAAISAVAGVTNVTVFYNATGLVVGTQQPLTISLIVEGGADADIAQAISDNLVFGLGLIGNTSINVDDGGQCRTILFTRSTDVAFTIQVSTDITKSVGVCTATSASTVKQILLDAFAGDLGLPGAFVSIEYLRSILIAQGVGVDTLTINNALLDIQLEFFEVGTLAETDITVTVI